ncbi:MAG: hypothetical protein LUD69_01590 [Oscillospiraceae bacterium]|nr:hypothetical protein [Oscillospiraceae bacterium]
MTTTDEILYSQDAVTINAGTGRLYYEGELDGGELPWDISVRYSLDGEECTAQALSDGAAELISGIAALREETEDMDTRVSEKIDELLESVTGSAGEIQSFVSTRNTHVESVQFVIQIQGVQAEETEQAEIEQETEMTFRQKFLSLFGLYTKDD